MFKAITFLKRKEGMSREQFIDYYEKHHQKLARRLLPPMADYRRSYPVYDDPLNYSGRFEGTDHDATAASAGGIAEEYDVIMEIWMQSREDFVKLLEVLRSPEVSKQFALDEEQLFERGGNRRVLIVEEYRSPPIGEQKVDYSLGDVFGESRAWIAPPTDAECDMQSLTPC